VKALKVGDCVTIAGEDKGENSWVVVIFLLEEK